MLSLLLLPALAVLISAEKGCGQHEMWAECTGCELKCGQDEKTPCAMICQQPSCWCSPSDGLRRAKDGKCIPVAQCPKLRAKRERKRDAEGACGPNEQFDQCGSCEGTCEQKFVPCKRICKKPGCYCVAGAGYVRDAQQNCIKFTDCPK